jgi:O-antigen/teichoic acid export membrane protein
LGAIATVVAASICALVVGALVLWLALWLVAIAAVAGLVAWTAFRFQVWRMRNRAPGAPPAPWIRR